MRSRERELLGAKEQWLAGDINAARAILNEALKKPQLFGDAALLPDNNPWVRTVLLCQCYLCKEDKYELAGSIHYANAIGKTGLEKLAEQ